MRLRWEPPVIISQLLNPGVSIWPTAGQSKFFPVIFRIQLKKKHLFPLSGKLRKWSLDSRYGQVLCVKEWRWPAEKGKDMIRRHSGPWSRVYLVDWYLMAPNKPCLLVQTALHGPLLHYLRWDLAKWLSLAIGHQQMQCKHRFEKHLHTGTYIFSCCFQNLVSGLLEIDDPAKSQQQLPDMKKIIINHLVPVTPWWKAKEKAQVSQTSQPSS